MSLTFEKGFLLFFSTGIFLNLLLLFKSIWLFWFAFILWGISCPHFFGSSALTTKIWFFWCSGFINSFIALGKYFLKKLWPKICSIGNLSLPFSFNILEHKSLASGSITLGHEILNLAILFLTASNVIPSKGGFPVINSNNKTPIHHISTVSSCPTWVTISGGR